MKKADFGQKNYGSIAQEIKMEHVPKNQKEEVAYQVMDRLEAADKNLALGIYAKSFLHLHKYLDKEYI